jgi:hypothetical protein
MTARDPRGQQKRSESRQHSCWRLFFTAWRPLVTGFAGWLRPAAVGYRLRRLGTACGRWLPASPVCYASLRSAWVTACGRLLRPAGVGYGLRPFVTPCGRGLRPGGRWLPASPVGCGLAAVGYRLRRLVTACGRLLRPAGVGYGLAAVGYRLRRCVTRRFAPRWVRPAGVGYGLRPCVTGFAGWVHRDKESPGAANVRPGFGVSPKL